MKWALVIVAVVACSVAAFFIWGGAHSEVAKDKVINKIDDLLGKTEVQRKDVQIAVKNMDKAIDELTKGRVQATVKSEDLQKQNEEMKKKLAEVDDSLLKLKGYLASQSDTEIAGKMYKHEQIEAMAEKVL